MSLVPSQIAFGNGQLIEVNGNVDVDVACQSLRDINHLSKENATTVVLGLAAQTDLYRSESKELQGAYIRQIERAVNEHWPKDGQSA